MKKKFLFKFHPKNGYDHIDVNENFRTYLGFSWKIYGKVWHFVFTVLPFGLNTTQFMFTKIVRLLVNCWHKYLINIACFLDDGPSVAEFSETICNS